MIRDLRLDRQFTLPEIPDLVRLLYIGLSSITRGNVLFFTGLHTPGAAHHNLTTLSSFLETLHRPTKTFHSATYDRISKRHGFEGHGKTVLITGGASGIGYNISKAFAEAGVARIAIISRSSAPLQIAKASLEAAHRSLEVTTYQASIDDYAKMTEILHEIGSLDVLILNAAIAHRRAKATEITMEEMQAALNINTLAAFHLVKTYLAMPSPTTGRKTVINISTAAAHMGHSVHVGYGTSKAAGVQVMQQFATQYKDDRNVNIFSLHPGAFYTPGVAANFPKHVADTMKWDDEDLPAHFALWLAGPDSECLRGRFLWANWDVDELIC